MKNQLIITAAFLAATMALCACGQTVPVPRQQEFPQPSETPSVVYYTREITPESLVKIFEALGVEPQGRVAVKISSGEAGGHNYLKPELIGELVQFLDGTIVECNTAYPGSRNTVKKHMKLMSEHGFDKIAPVDIMDAEGSMTIPVSDTTWILKDIVGSHPAEPLLQDRGIMASLDPVAVDKACLDLVFNIIPSEGDDNGPLLERIKSRHGTHIVEWGEHIGLGSSRYVVVDLDRQ